MFEDTQGGNNVRPVIVWALSAAVNHHDQCNDTAQLDRSDVGHTPSLAQIRLGDITEMVHMASLLHDDVIDMEDMRRGAESINKRFGNQFAVIAGDFLLARASVHLARLGSTDITALYAKLITELVKVRGPAL